MVKIRFKSYDRSVLPEMSAKVNFLAREVAGQKGASDAVLTVPGSAVVRRDGRQVVYQIKENRAVEVPVTVGRSLGTLLEIKQGLKEGDRVISNVDERISDGAKVVVKTS
jgi:hypothetical protein